MKLDISFFIIMIIAIIATLNDIVIFFFHTSYISSLLISIIIIFLITILLIKNKQLILENNFNKIDLVFLIPFLIFSILKIMTPDYMYDVVSYHYYKQENPFLDKIKFDFLVSGGKVNSFVFPLGDRMNYIFRYFLGMRLGNVLSYFSLVVVFYQIKKFLTFYCIQIKEFIKVIAGMLPISFYTIYLYFGTYYIDNYSLIFLLEIIYIALSNNQIFKQKNKLFFLVLLCGITIGIKISNFVILIPIGIFTIVKNISDFKTLRIKDYVISAIIFFSPFLVYALKNYLDVGNPFFPFLGGEEYYDNNHWQDDTFGIPNFWYSFIWPIIIVLNPEKGFNLKVYDYIWLYGYIFLIVNILLNLFKEIKYKKLLELEILTFSIVIFWANFLMGYTRYASVIPILFSIIMIVNISILLQNKKMFLKLLGIMQSIILLVILYNGVLNCCSNISFYNKNFKNNFKYAIKDKNTKIHIDGVWGNINACGGIISLIREEETPIYNLENWHIEGSDFFINKYREILKDKEIYILFSDLYRPIDLNKVQDLGFEVIEKFQEYTQEDLPYLQNYDTWTIYKIRYKPK